MPTTFRNRFMLFGASWAPLLALLRATLAFDRFALGPFLPASLLLAALGGAAAALVSGGRASRGAEVAGRGWAVASGAGALQGIVAVVLAALSIWLAPTVTMTGFSPAAPGKVFVLFGEPGVFSRGALAVLVVFVYVVSVGLLRSPLVRSTIPRLTREGGVGASRGVAGEIG